MIGGVDESSAVHAVTEWILQILTLVSGRIFGTEAAITDFCRLFVGELRVVVVWGRRLTSSTVQTRILSLTQIEEENEGLFTFARLFQHVNTSKNGTDTDGRTIAKTNGS